MASKSGFYGWMFNGERVYQAFGPHFSLFKSGEKSVAESALRRFPMP
jgi:hypothetical protein